MCTINSDLSVHCNLVEVVTVRTMCENECVICRTSQVLSCWYRLQNKMVVFLGVRLIVITFEIKEKGRICGVCHDVVRVCVLVLVLVHERVCKK